MAEMARRGLIREGNLEEVVGCLKRVRIWTCLLRFVELLIYVIDDNRLSISTFAKALIR